LTPKLDEKSNEYWLFHGTKSEYLDVLLNVGYDVRIGSLIGMFGGGFYLAENPTKSNQYIPCPTCGKGSVFTSGNCDCKKEQVYSMIIFRTTLGLPHLAIDYKKEKYCGISSKSTVNIPGFGKYISASKDSIDSFVRRPPLIPGSFETYDSVLGESKGNGGNKLEYREFILYDNHRAYPEYIIEFKRSVKSPKVDKNLFQKVLSVFLSQKPTSEVVNLD
jgi:hypothetical protein